MSKIWIESWKKSQQLHLSAIKNAYDARVSLKIGILLVIHNDNYNVEEAKWEEIPTLCLDR